MSDFTKTTIQVAGADVSGANPLPVNATSSIAAFAPTGQAALAVTTTTANVALASVGPTAVVVNTGTVDAFINFGSNTVTATTSSYLLKAGWGIAFNIGTNTYIAAITSSGTTNLAITTGTGLPALASAGSGGTGGAVTLTGVPAAASLADNTCNPSTLLLGSMEELWSPELAVWQRAQCDLTGHARSTSPPSIKSRIAFGTNKTTAYASGQVIGGIITVP